VIEAVKQGRIEGIKPVEMFASDFTSPVTADSKVQVDVHNVLNRSVAGTLAIAGREEKISLAPGETKRVGLPLGTVSGEQVAANAIPCTIRFESDAGDAELKETFHVNTITRGTPKIDGDLTDWKSAIPVRVYGTNAKRDAIESAWRPWEKETEAGTGMAEITMMWDDVHLYVAVRERSKDWKPKQSLSRRNDGDYFGKDDMAHTYVRDAQDGAPYQGHCLQIGLDTQPGSILPAYDKAPARMIAQDDTDYEYAVWQTPEGNAEIWRSVTPEMKLFHFMPRCMPAGYNGEPKGASAVVRREGNDTIYEVALPLADMRGFSPKAGLDVPITFRLPGSNVDFGAGRSRTRTNGMTLLPRWIGSPSNEIVWRFQAAR
jgi:hypothetical protein